MSAPLPAASLSSGTRFVKAGRAVLTAAASSALLSALIDVALAAHRSPDAVPAGSFLRALLGAAGLYGGAALLVGAVAAVVLGSVAAVLPTGPKGIVGSLLAWLRA